MPAFSKPVQPTSVEDIPRSSRKWTLHPKLASEDNVHPQAKAIKRQKLEAESNKVPAKLPASRSMSQVKPHGQKRYTEVEEDDDKDVIMNDNEKGQEIDKVEKEDHEDEESKSSQKDEELEEELEDVGSQEELDGNELGMLCPLF